MTARRWRPLTTSLVVAGVFALGRVIFRCVFGGAAAGGPALPSLPSVHLPAPFSSVMLFGPITLGGIGQVLVQAVPVMLVIVASGFLFSIVEARRLIVRTRRFGAGTLTLAAVLIATSVLPELRLVTGRLLRARKLRGLRGPTRMVAPAIGATIERATALAGSLEVRGYLGSSRTPEPDCAAPVEARGVRLWQPGRFWCLDDVHFRLPAGTTTLVTGATGSGKSSLLRALAGLFDTFDHGGLSGDLIVGGISRVGLPARATAGFVGYVPQDVRASFIGRTVAEEIGMNLTLRGKARGEVDAAVAVIARETGTTPLLDRDVETLSAGESTLVALAAALVQAPSILLLDEPFADLDQPAVARVSSLITRLARETGVTLVIAEHLITQLAHCAQQRLHLERGTVRVISVTKDVSIEDGPLVMGSDEVSPSGGGDIVAVVGVNGSGKTTLLHHLASHSTSGVEVRLVTDHPVDMFFAQSVGEECAAHDRRQRLNLGTTLSYAESLLGTRLDPDEHPRDLSAGQQRVVAIALQAVSNPDVLLIDEPTKGLDPRARAFLAVTLTRLAARGCRILLATHDTDFVARVSARRVTVQPGHEDLTARVDRINSAWVDEGVTVA